MSTGPGKHSHPILQHTSDLCKGYLTTKDSDGLKIIWAPQLPSWQGLERVEPRSEGKAANKGTAYVGAHSRLLEKHYRWLPHGANQKMALIMNPKLKIYFALSLNEKVFPNLFCTWAAITEKLKVFHLLHTMPVVRNNTTALITFLIQFQDFVGTGFLQIVFLLLIYQLFFCNLLCNTMLTTKLKQAYRG